MRLYSSWTENLKFLSNCKVYFPIKGEIIHNFNKRKNNRFDISILLHLTVYRHAIEQITSRRVSKCRILPQKGLCHKALHSKLQKVRVFLKKFRTSKTEHFWNLRKQKVRKFPSNAGPYFVTCKTKYLFALVKFSITLEKALNIIMGVCPV